jgi:hypothetical protein
MVDMKRLAFFSLCVVLFFLMSCQPGKLVQSMPTVQPSLTNSSTDLFSSTSTYTPLPTIANALTTFTPAPPSSKTYLALPSWLKQPKSNILMYRLSDENKNPVPTVLFLNPESGEIFQLPLPSESPRPFFWWHDDHRAVFQPGVGEGLAVLDLSDGSLTYYSPADPAYSTLEWVIPSWDVWYSTEFQSKSTVLNILDESAGTTHSFSTLGMIPSNGTYFSYDKKYVAIPLSTGQLVFGASDHIAVYSYEDQSLVMSIEDTDIHIPEFIPNSYKLLYLRGTKIPCIVDISLQQRKCIHEISNAFPNANIFLRGLSSDNQQLLFIHSESNNEDHHGGMCTYNLVSGKLNCPLENLSVLERNAVTAFALSPDEKYVAFFYNEHPPESDYMGEGGLSVIKMDGTQFTNLGTPIDLSAPLIDRVIHWRPISTDIPNP